MEIQIAPETITDSAERYRSMAATETDHIVRAVYARLAGDGATQMSRAHHEGSA